MEKLGVFLVVLTLGLVSCGAEKQRPPSTPGEVFSEPYFPRPQPTIAGRAVQDWDPDWKEACVYDASLLTEAQSQWVAGLEPAGGEGQVGLGFSQDFDGDGAVETVSWGAYRRTDGDQGNFLLVIRAGSGPPPLLLKEFPGAPRFTVFTLKPDGTLWFNGGIEAGEVTMNLTWDQGLPTFHRLTEE